MNSPDLNSMSASKRGLQGLLPFLRTSEKTLAKSLVTPRRAGHASELESRWLQSATAVRLRGGIVARSWGSGPKVLLVHGWNARGTQLCSYIEPLVRRGYEVVAIDLPGHGDSAGRFLTPLKARDALIDVGEQLGPLHSVVAHGYGAGAALWAIGSSMEAGKLVVLAGWSHYLWKEYAAVRQLPQRSLQLFEKQLEKLFKHPPKMLAIENVAERITTPVLLVHGKSDTEISKDHAERNFRMLPTARLKLLDGMSHMDLLFEPRAVSEVLRFVVDDYEPYNVAA